MNLSLGPDAEKLIREKLSSGQYARAEDVVLAGLEALKQQTDDDFEPGELEALLAEGERQLERRGPVDAQQVFDELRQMSRQRQGRDR